MAMLYALHHRSLDELIEFFPSQEKAETALAEILFDEPQWRELLDVVPVELEVSPN
jgi:hypothetical protein